MSAIQRGERFSGRFELSSSSIRAFALAAADHNPIHQDLSAARRARFKTLVASGPQLSSLLMGVTATHFSRIGEMLGLEFNFYFRAPVLAGDVVEAEWLIVRVRRKESLDGYLVDLRGRMKCLDGTSAVGASGRVLVRPEGELSCPLPNPQSA